MTKNKVERHALAQRHFRQIVCRPSAMRKRMMPVWAITWRPGDRSGSFLGQLFRPLGSATLMSQVSYPRDDGREGIGLLGIGAQIDPYTATVTYDEVRLRHDFGRVPFVGARGAILDPSDDQVGERGNGSWVQLALEVDRVRQRMATSNFHLPSVPQLPEIYFGYSRKEVARYEVTPELCRYAARGMEVCWTGNALSDIGQLEAETAAAQDKAFAALSAEQQEQLLREAWDAAFIPPSDPDNGTGLWLLPHALTTDVYRTVRMFEYFGGLVEARVYNPARRLNGKTVPNPAIAVAKEAGIDLVGDLALLADTAERTPEFQQIEQRLIDLVPAFRGRVQAADAISDQDLLNAICQPELPVAVEPPLQSLPEPEQIRLMRANLKPHVSQSCTDEDILAAVRDPNGPLYAAGLCRVQALNRNVHVPLTEALNFSPLALGRDRVQATLWHDDWPRRKDDREAVQQLLAAAA